MRGLPSILSLFRNVFNKFNNTGARTLDDIKLQFWPENLKIFAIFYAVIVDVVILLHGDIALPDFITVGE